MPYLVKIDYKERVADDKNWVAFEVNGRDRTSFHKVVFDKGSSLRLTLAKNQ